MHRYRTLYAPIESKLDKLVNCSPGRKDTSMFQEREEPIFYGDYSLVEVCSVDIPSLLPDTWCMETNHSGSAKDLEHRGKDAQVEGTVWWVKPRVQVRH